MATIESNGGVRNAYTMKTNTTYHSVVPTAALELVLWAEADRMHALRKAGVPYTDDEIRMAQTNLTAQAKKIVVNLAVGSISNAPTTRTGASPSNST